MATEKDQISGYRASDLTIDLAERRIRRNGRFLHCGKLTFDLLVLLAREAPRVVTKEEVIRELWAGRYASPATVKRRVALLREALSDDQENPAYVRTTRGQGYSLIPPVRPMSSLHSRIPNWARPMLVACAFLLVFVFGAEIGYQDGLRPMIFGHQGTTRIVVTAWPYELSGSDYAFVHGTATALTNVLQDGDMLSRLPGFNSLTVMARATTNDVETIYITLALLSDDSPDYRPSRDNELAYWSRELQDVRNPGPDYRTHVLPAGPADRHFLLVSNLRFDRNEIAAQPLRLQADAASAIAIAIDAQLPIEQHL